MNFTALMILICLLVGALLFIRRRTKRRDNFMNRYREYRSPSNEKTKVRRNRYYPTTTVRREPKLGDSLTNNPTGASKKIESTKEQKAMIEDSDVILGLKEHALSTQASREKPIPNEAQIVLKPFAPKPPTMTFYVMAEKEQPYNGYELLQAILSINARFGQHQIFHRYQEKTGHGPILFSIASATKPGTFDLSNMGGFSTPGLCLFFSAGDVEESLVVYELMLQTAGQLIEDLGGHVFDEHHQRLTPTTVVNQRRLLREYLQKKQIPNFFEEMAE